MQQPLSSRRAQAQWWIFTSWYYCPSYTTNTQDFVQIPTRILCNGDKYVVPRIGFTATGPKTCEFREDEPRTKVVVFEPGSKIGIKADWANGVVNSQDGVPINQLLEVLRFARTLNRIAEGRLLVLPVAAEDPRTYYNTIETSIPPARARMQQQENFGNVQQDLQHE